MNVINNIRLILLQKGEVIFPNFGTLNTVYQSAKFDEEGGILNPPKKIVTFTPSQSIKSDMLAKHIADLKQIDYKEAETEVTSYLTKIKSALNKGQKVYLTKIGVLFYLNNKLTFVFDETQNFLPNAANLTPVKAISLMKETTKPVTKPIVNKTTSPKLPSTKTKTKTKTIIKDEPKVSKKRESPALAVILLIILIAMVLILFDSFEIGLPENRFSERPHIFNNNVDKSEIIDKIIQDSKTNLYQAPQPIDTEESKPEVDEDIIQEEAQETIKTEEVISGSLSLEPVVRTNQYHILVASYKSLRAAKRNLYTWDNLGKDVQIIGPGRYGHYRISLDRYGNKNTAIDELWKVRENLEANAWLLRY
jgi:nucleoid DNA-binding protein